MKLSIITINYNDAKGLEKTLRSVAGQTVQPFEYIVVDGGSTDGSLDVIKKYEHIITRWVSEKDNGIYNAMNKGVALAQGDYCQFLNAGDSFYDETVLREVFHKHKGSDIVFGHLYLSQGGIFTVNNVSLMTFYRSSVPHPSAFIKRELLLEFPYDEKLRIVSDWKFFMQVMVEKNASYEVVDVIAVNFDTSGISSTNEHLNFQERRRVLEEEVAPRILADYDKFSAIGDYTSTPYDDFFIRLRPTRYGEIIYKMSVLLMRCVSFLKKDVDFVKGFPLDFRRRK